MKKLTSLFLLSVIPLTLASCGTNTNNKKNSSSSTSKSEKVTKNSSSKKASTKTIGKDEAVKILNAHGYSGNISGAEVTQSSENKTVIEAKTGNDDKSKNIYTLIPSGKDQVKITAKFTKENNNGEFQKIDSPAGIEENQTVKRSPNENSSAKSSSTTTSQSSNNLNREELTSAEKKNHNQPLPTESIQNSQEAVNLLTQKYGNQNWKVNFDSIGKSSPIYFHITGQNGNAFYVYADGSIQNADGDLSSFSNKIKD